MFVFVFSQKFERNFFLISLYFLHLMCYLFELPVRDVVNAESLKALIMPCLQQPEREF